MDKSILNSIISFFKSIGQKGATGEPINENWASSSKNIDAKEQAKQELLVEIEKRKSIHNKKSSDLHINLVNDVTPDETPKTIELTPIEATNEKVTLPPELTKLQEKFTWRSLKVKTPLPISQPPEPFYFIGKDKQPVVANRAEVSFIKELLTKAAEAGIKNRFSFTLSKTHEIVIKYRYKLLGRVFLQGKKHRMVFKVDGNTFILENLSLAECKKLLLIWLGQIKAQSTAS